MTHPLVQALTSRHGFAVVDEANLDSTLAAHPATVLFFPGDADRLVETADVAVILPELVKAFCGGLTPALVAAPAERILQRRFRFNAFPALVFCRPEGYLGVITRVLDWGDYVREIKEILARNPGEPPAFEFPEGCYANGLKRGDGHGHDHDHDHEHNHQHHNHHHNGAGK